MVLSNRAKALRLIRRCNSVAYNPKFIEWSDSDDDEEEAFFSSDDDDDDDVTFIPNVILSETKLLQSSLG